MSNQEQLEFTRNDAAIEQSISACPTIWQFDPRRSMATPFYGLISEFGADLILELDALVLDEPKSAAARATKIYQKYSSQSQADRMDVREVMGILRDNLKQAAENGLSDDPIMPESSVYKGMRQR